MAEREESYASSYYYRLFLQTPQGQDYVQDVLRQLCFSKKRFFVVGDFNDNLLVKVNKLSAIIGNVKLTQLIDEPIPSDTHICYIIRSNYYQ